MYHVHVRFGENSILEFAQDFCINDPQGLSLENLRRIYECITEHFDDELNLQAFPEHWEKDLQYAVEEFRAGRCTVCCFKNWGDTLGTTIEVWIWDIVDLSKY